MVPALLRQLLASNGLEALRSAIAEPERYAIEPKVGGLRRLIVPIPCRRRPV